MHFLKGKITIISITTLLVLTLLYPTFIQLEHILEKDDHHHVTEICEHTTEHFHESPVDCSICDFHFTSFTKSFFNYSFQTKTYFFIKKEIFTTFFKYTTSQSSVQLRGPPFMNS